MKTIHTVWYSLRSVELPEFNSIRYHDRETARSETKLTENSIQPFTLYPFTLPASSPRTK